MRCILYTHGGELIPIPQKPATKCDVKAATFLAVLTKSDMLFSDMRGRLTAECLVGAYQDIHMSIMLTVV